MQAFTRGSISVDTFFMMSGLLISYSLLREFERNQGRFNVLSFYLHRYIRYAAISPKNYISIYFYFIFQAKYLLRISPVYYLCLGFIATLLVYLGSGPMWHFVHQMSQACRLNWWTHFLYVDNLLTRFNAPATEVFKAIHHLSILVNFKVMYMVV